MPRKGIDKLSHIAYDFAITAMSKRTYPNIAARMSATGETQVELAQILGRSQPYVSKLVRNLIQPSLDEALRISSVLRIPVESLVSEVNRSEFLVEK